MVDKARDFLLTHLAVGETDVVERVLGERMQRMKLLDLGLTPGTRVSVMKIAPMGNPIEIAVRGCLLTLRKEEAALVLMGGKEFIAQEVCDEP